MKRTNINIANNITQPNGAWIPPYGKDSEKSHTTLRQC